MKKIILTFILLLIIPKNTKALMYADDTTHLSHNLPYYTNTFNSYDKSNYSRALNIIKNSARSLGSNLYYYMIIKDELGKIRIVQYITDTYTYEKMKYARLKYIKNSNYYTFNFSYTNTTSTYQAFHVSTPITSSTTANSFTNLKYEDFNISTGYELFRHYKGHSISGYNGSNFVTNNSILYSEFDLKIVGSNIYNDNILLKINLFGNPYTYSSTNQTDLYSSINFNQYNHQNIEYLKTGDTFYSADLTGSIFTYSSTNHNNLSFTIQNTNVTSSSFDIQVKTDNYSSIERPPALYGCGSDDKCTFISYLTYADKTKPFLTSYIGSFDNLQFCVSGVCKTIGNYAVYQLRFDFSKDLDQNVTVIFNGDNPIIPSYDLSDFEYVKPDEGGGYPTPPSDDRNDNGWFDRTEDYFNKLGDMELLEKLNPIYWLKGLGFILVDLFVPTNEFFETWQQETMDKLKSNFDITSIVNIAKELKDLLDVSNNEVPQLEMDFSFMNIDGFGKFKFDFSWYTKYRPVVHNFIIAVLLVNTLFWLIRKVSGLLS